ncbi:MAG: tetratricopeptide repeat protein, partial [Moorea sp. SIO2B7]|nr:tetratricopeptide repeat protein [Moorena sp. SIO2B7]
ANPTATFETSLGSFKTEIFLAPNAPVQLRDRGLIYSQLGYLSEACQDLERYLEILPQAEDADIIRRLLKQIGNE